MADFRFLTGRALFCESLMHPPAPEITPEIQAEGAERRWERRKAFATIPREDYSWDGERNVWKRLANAVIIQAGNDWLEGTRRLRTDPLDEEAQALLQDAEEFFLSDDYLMFSKYDGKTLLHRLQRLAGQPPHGEGTR